MWQSPAIFLQQAISVSVISALGRQAKAGVAIHVKSRTNTNMDWYFAMSKCYLPRHLRCKKR
jgi:hypothetical protein